jgi:hypothetical protein
MLKVRVKSDNPKENVLSSTRAFRTIAVKTQLEN